MIELKKELFIVNLTPHEITIEGVGTFEPRGNARVKMIKSESFYLGKIRITEQNLGEIEGLPDPKENVIYIVSNVVLSALKNTRKDVYAPDTGSDATRNAEGQIVSVKGLIQ